MNLQDAEHKVSGPSRITEPRLAILRGLCLAEATTLLALLLVAVPMKHLAGYPIAVSVMGPIHGFVFLVFGWRVVQAMAAGDISGRTGAKLIVAAFVPFGGIYSWRALR
ncbi:DUF3817 domain-containing protein [Thiomonas intermedia]|uniref:DUF3817 domain-containing protein n=1 Tax=Thiomonas intermedia TaxID=926 RepID=UPI0009A53405|nr:DUF3817 domain-containing protein [Thiomonas intermedia]